MGFGLNFVRKTGQLSPESAPLPLARKTPPEIPEGVFIVRMEPTRGFEPRTPALRVRCSGQLSYVGAQDGSIPSAPSDEQERF